MSTTEEAEMTDIPRWLERRINGIVEMLDNGPAGADNTEPGLEPNSDYRNPERVP